MNGRIYKRGGVWWLDYSFRGKRYRESSHSDRKTDAKDLLRRRLEEMGKGQLIGPSAEKVTLRELLGLLIADYEQNGRRSMERTQIAIRRLQDKLGEETRALDITTPQLNRYVADRLADGVGAGTVQRELGILARSFKLAVQAGLLATAPYVPSLRVTNVRTGFVEREDLDALLAELPEYLRGPMLFGYLTGWRVKSEVLPLTWSQVDFNAGIVRLEVGTTKNQEGREFPFTALPELDALLRDRWARRSGLYAFHHNGRRIRSYKSAWYGARRRASIGKRNGLEVVTRPKLAGIIVHDLRRSAVRNLVRAGVPEVVAMRLCGHKTRAIFDRYSIVAPSDLREGVAKLAAQKRHNRADASLEATP
jgi:integrase